MKVNDKKYDKSLPSVLVIGELNVDIVLSGLTSPPQFGAEILAQDLRMVLGSASAIFANGVARLGQKRRARREVPPPWPV